jgi:hypothetical protein
LPPPASLAGRGADVCGEIAERDLLYYYGNAQDVPASVGMAEADRAKSNLAQTFIFSE